MRFDALKLSAAGESLEGVVEPADLPRVADRLAADAGAARLAWRLVGGRDAQARPALTLTLAGSVPLVCQRCLQPFAAIVDQSTELLLARSEAELARWDVDGCVPERDDDGICCHAADRRGHSQRRDGSHPTARVDGDEDDATLATCGDSDEEYHEDRR